MIFARQFAALAAKAGKSSALAGIAATFALLGATHPAQALDNGVITTGNVTLAGTGCIMHVRADDSSDPDDSLIISTSASLTVSLERAWYDGRSDSSFTDLTPASLISHCRNAISNVQLFTVPLSGETFASDEFYGFTYEVGGTGYRFGVEDTAPNAPGGTSLVNGITAPADSTPPVVQSIALSGAPASNANSVTYAVTFDENASNISTDDFIVTPTSGTAAGSVASVSAASGTSVNVVVDTISGSGGFRLDLIANTNIIDDANNGNGTNGSVAAFTGAVHTVDFPTVTLSASSTNPGEGDSPITITATSTLAAEGTITVPLLISGTATGSGTDYTLSGNSITIADGATTGTITITLTDDAIDEDAESIILDMGSPSGNNATESGVQQQIISIADNDNAPTLAINDVSVNEGASGATTLTFTVTKTGATSKTVTANYATEDGSAFVANGDYTAASGSLSFLPSETTKTITVNATGDAVVEANETFKVGLSAPSNATLLDATGLGTITNDDTATVTIADVTVNEGDGTATVTLTLDNAVDTGFALFVSTADNTATTADGDYTAVTNQSLGFAGTAGETETIVVTIGDDTKVEADEIIDVAMSTVLVAVVSSSDIDITDTASITLTNDDSADVTIANVSGNEDDGAITVTVTLDTDVDGGFDVDVSTADGTATTADSDYTADASQTLTFAGTAGESETFTITPTADANNESDETVVISMSNVVPVKAAASAIDITDGATLTILNDESLGFSVNDPILTEGASGVTTLTFTITLSGPAPAGGASVDVSTSDGSATAGSDYAATALATVNFAVGATSNTFDVYVAGDNTVEADETLTLTLSNPTGTDVVISDATGIGTITNDDTAEVTIADVAVNENAGTATLTLSLNNAVDGGLSVDLSTADNTATTADADYAAITNQTVTFAGTASETEQVSVTLGGDFKVEADETIDVSLSGLSAPNVDAGDVTITDTASVTLTNDDRASVTIADIANAENGAFTFTLSVDNAVDGGFDLDVSTSDGSATAGSDYSALTSQTVSFAGTASETEQVTVIVSNDNIVEANETFSISMSALNPGVVSNASIDILDGATATINNTDTATVSIANASVSEGGTLSFSVSLDNPVDGTFVVNAVSSDATALGSGVDYASSNAALSFSGTSGETKTVTSATTDDSLVEDVETFTMTLSLNGAPSVVAASALTVTDTATGTINDNDTTTLTIADVSQAENGTFTLTVNSSTAVDGGFTVDLNTADGTATAGSDYTALSSETVTFAGTANEDETVTLTVSDDAVVEANETLTVSMANKASGTAPIASIDATDGATVTIQNNDTTTLTIADTSGNEDDGAITVTVTSSAAVDGGFDVDVSTADGTATVADSDYSAVAGRTLTFAGTAGETETFTVTPTADVTSEPNETVSVSMSGVVPTTVSAASISSADTATVTFNNDDSIGFSINDPTLAEGDSGAVTMSFTVSLSAPAPAGGASVNAATSNGTAIGGLDFTTKNTTLFFTAGAVSQTFTVDVASDNIVEANETFTVTLTNPTGTNVVINDATGTGTITNDDTTAVTIADVTVNENTGTATMVLSLSNAVQGGFSVDLSSADNTATTADSDYTAITGQTVTFAGTPSETENVSVTIGTDAKVEADELVDFAMSNLVPVSAAAGNIDITDTAALTISNDDTATITIADASGAENGGAITLTATLSAEVDGTLSVDLATADGTATTADNDYSSFSGQTLTFSGTAGETQTIAFNPIGDTNGEADETLIVSMSNATASTVSTANLTISDTATVTILNDDSINMTVNDPSVAEGDSGSATLTFTVSLSAPAPAGGATVNVSTSDGTASAGTDYTGVNTTLSFAAGTTSQTVDVTVAGDTAVEAAETLTLTLTGATGLAVVITDAVGTGTITNDDTAELVSIERLPPAAQLTNASAITFQVTFSDNVTGVSSLSFNTASFGFVSNVAPQSLTVYNVTITTPAASAGTGGLSLRAGHLIQDRLGNAIATAAPTGADETYTVDRIAPTITQITRGGTQTTNADSIDFSVTFSETVSGLSAADFAVNGGAGSVSNVSAASGTNVTVTVSGNGLASHIGTIGLNIAAAPSAADAAGNTLSTTEPATDETYMLDNAAPLATSIARQTPTGETTNADSLVFRVTFDTALAGIGPSDFTVTGTSGASVTSLSATSGTTTDVTVSGGTLASHTGTVGLDISAAPTGADAAGNTLAATEPDTDETYTLDNTAPTVLSIERNAPSSEVTNSSTVQFLVTFSKPVSSVALADFTVNGSAGSVSGGGMITPTTLQLSVNGLGSANGAIGIDIAAAPGLTDLAGNTLSTTEPATDETYTIDSTSPTVQSIVRKTPSGEDTSADSLVFTVTFSDALTNLSGGDFEVVGTAGSVASISATSGNTVDVTVGGNGLASHDGTIGIKFIAAPGATDLAGNNLNPASPATDQTFELDNTAPTVALSAPAGPFAGDFTVTATFSEAMTGFALGDISVTNGTPSALNTADNITYTFTVSPDADGNVLVDIPASRAVDKANLPNAAATQISRSADITAPTVAITAPSVSTIDVSGAFSVTITFSEAVTDFTLGDISVGNGAASNLATTDNTVFTANITPKTNGNVTVDVAAAAAKDGLNNNSLAAPQFSISNDETAPTVVISVPAGTQKANFTATLTFSELVAGLQLNEINVTGGTASNLRTTDGGTTYLVDIAANNSGPVTISLANAIAIDKAGNPVAAAVPVAVSVDADAPVVTLSGPSTPVTTAFALTVTASEDITGLALADFAVTNGSASNLVTNSASSYAVTITPTALGQSINVTLAAGAVDDLAGNPSAAPATFAILAGSPETEFESQKDAVIDTVQQDERQKLDNEIATNRKMINGAMQRFVRRNDDDAPASRNIAFDVTGSVALSLSTQSTNGTFFGQTELANGNLRTASGNFNITRDKDGSVNAQLAGRVSYERKVSETLNTGIFYGASLNAGKVSGNFEGETQGIGLIVGAYALKQFSESIYGDVYAGLGYNWSRMSISNKTLKLEGTYDTWSAYAGARLTGRLSLGENVELRPNVALDYGYTDIGVVGLKASAYGLSSNVSQDYGSVSVLEFTFTPEFIFTMPSAKVPTILSAQPRFICRNTTGRKTVQECGAGLALGIEGQTEDGKVRYGVKVDYQDTGRTQRTSADIFVDIQF